MFCWISDIPNTRQADAVVKRTLNTQYTENLAIAHVDDIKQTLSAGILAGKSEKDIAKSIREGTDDELWRAKRLTRTELTAAASEGELEALREADIERYRFYAALDERTCPECGKHDMEEYAVSEAQEGVNKPPMHPNCRCVVTAVIPGEKKEELVRRGRDENGKSVVMPPGMTYGQWKKEYGPEEKVKGDPMLGAMAAGVQTSTLTTDGENAAQTDFARSSGKTNSDPVTVKWSEPYEASPFKDATTHQELAQIAKERYNIDLKDAEKADFKLMQSSMNNLSKVLNENTNIRDNIGIVRVMKDDEYFDNGEAFAATETVVRDDKRVVEFRLNEEWYKDPEAMQRAIDGDPEFLVQGTKPDNMMIHELGHGANYSLVLNDKSLDQDYLLYEGNEVHKLYRERASEVVDTIIRRDPKMDYLFLNNKAMYTEMKKEIRESISEYAGYNDREAIAEAFNDVFINGENAQGMSKEIYKSLKDLLGML